MEIIQCPADDPNLLALIAAHAAFCAAHTPGGSGHALNAKPADLAGIRYWVAVDADRALGCLGLKDLAPQIGELKSLHVRDGTRGHGVGAALVKHVIEHARATSIKQLVLETGQSDGFAPSRRLYARLGFSPCPAFGDYTSDPFSYCMAQEI